MSVKTDTCAICTKPMRGQGHEVCRTCVKSLGWAEARFGWFPERLADRNAHRRSQPAGTGGAA